MISASIIEHLKGQAGLTALLVRYNGEPAIFDRRAPDLQDSLWDGDTYPYIVCTADLAKDEEQQRDGVLIVHIRCEKDRQYSVDIERVLRPLVDGYLFIDGSDTYAAASQAVAGFAGGEENEAELIATYSLIKLSEQALAEPDAVALMNAYTKGLMPGAYLIGYDPQKSAAWKPTDAEPALYWRLVSIGPCEYINDSRACIWKTVTLQLHIFAQQIAAEVANALDYNLSALGRLKFPDQGPFIIDRTALTAGAPAGEDEQRVGQFSLTGTYGILRDQQEEKLEHLYVR